MEKILNNGSVKSELGNISRTFTTRSFQYKIEKKLGSNIFTIMVKKGNLIRRLNMSMESIKDIGFVMSEIKRIRTCL